MWLTVTNSLTTPQGWRADWINAKKINTEYNIPKIYPFRVTGHEFKYRTRQIIKHSQDIVKILYKPTISKHSTQFILFMLYQTITINIWFWWLKGALVFKRLKSLAVSDLHSALLCRAKRQYPLTFENTYTAFWLCTAVRTHVQIQQVLSLKTTLTNRVDEATRYCAPPRNHAWIPSVWRKLISFDDLFCFFSDVSSSLYSSIDDYSAPYCVTCV